MEIRYPTEKWLIAYQNKHGCDREHAEQVWWDNEIDHDRPTPFDLSDEQAKIAKEMGPKARAVNAYGKAVKRERKPNETKRWIITRLSALLEGYALHGDLSDLMQDNPERSLSFTKDGKRYTLTLTEHRPPKG